MATYKLILFLCLCTNSRVFSAPSSSDAEINSINSAENLKRSQRQTQDIDIEKSRELIFRLQSLLSLFQLRPSQNLGVTSPGQNIQSQPQGELIVKLPLNTPTCYAQHFLQNPELIVLFHRVVEICGGDPNLLLVGLDQASQNMNNGGLLGGLGGLLGGNGGGLLGGLGGLLGGQSGQGGLLGGLGGLLGGGQGGLLGGLGGLLGTGNQGGLLGGLGGLLGGGGQGGLLGGLGGLLGGNGQFGNGGLLGGLGGLLGGSGQKGLLPGLGGLLGGGQSGQSGLLPGLGGLLGGNGGKQGGQTGAYSSGDTVFSNEEDCDEETLASDNVGLLNGVLGGGQSSGGLLGNVLGGGQSNGGLLGGVLGENNGGGGGLINGLTGGLTSGITGGIINGVTGGVVNSVENTVSNMPIVGNLLRRHANEDVSKEVENTDNEFTQTSIEIQTMQPNTMNQQNEMSQKILTNTIQRNEPRQDDMQMMMLMNQEMSNNQEIKQQDVQNFDVNGLTDDNTLGKVFKNGVCDGNTHVCNPDATSVCDCNQYCECLSNFKQFSDKQKPKRKYRRRKYKIVEAPKDLDIETQIPTNTDDLFESPSQHVKTIDNNGFRNGFNAKQQFESNEKQRQIDEYFY